MADAGCCIEDYGIFHVCTFGECVWRVSGENKGQRRMGLVSLEVVTVPHLSVNVDASRSLISTYQKTKCDDSSVI